MYKLKNTSIFYDPYAYFCVFWTRTPSLASSFSTSITVLVLLFCLTPGMSEWYLYKLKNTSIFYDPCAFLLISAFHRPLAKLVKSLLWHPYPPPPPLERGPGRVVGLQKKFDPKKFFGKWFDMARKLVKSLFYTMRGIKVQGLNNLAGLLWTICSFFSCL